MTKKSELLADLRTVGSDIFPYRNFDHWEPADDLLILGLYLKREILLRLPIKGLPAGYPDGYDPQPTARGRGKREPVE